MILAIVAGFIIADILGSQLGDISGDGGLGRRPSLQELIESLVPSSIFVPFETIMPFPLIFVALIVTYAFCSVGKYFDKLKAAVDVCYTLFSRMLHVVMSAFPFFCFVALLYPLLGSGFIILLLILYIIVLSAASLVILAAFYLVRLLIGGVKLRPFFKHLPAFAEGKLYDRLRHRRGSVQHPILCKKLWNGSKTDRGQVHHSGTDQS